MELTLNISEYVSYSLIVASVVMVSLVTVLRNRK